MQNKNHSLRTRLTALLLVLICVLGLFPTTAFAASDTITLKEFGHSGVGYESAALGRCTLHEMTFKNGNKDTVGFCGTKGGGMGTSLQGQTWGGKTSISDPTVETMMAYYYAHSTGVFTDEAKALGVNDVWGEDYRWYMNAWVQACIWRYKQGSISDPVVACAEELMAVYNTLKGTHYTSIDQKQDNNSFRDRTQYILDLGSQGVWGKCHVYEYSFTGAGSSSHPASSVQKIILGDLEIEQIDQEEYAIIVKKVDATNPSKGLPGAGFHIEAENGSYSKDIITGDNGTYRISGLTAGTYAVTETSPPPGGYEIDSVAPQYVVLPGNGSNTVTVTFRDTTTITGEGSIRKVDADNPTKGLAGAVIKITGVDNSFTGTYITDNGGYLTEVPWDTMPIGSFIAEEVTPPEGFSLSPDASKVKQSFHWDGKVDVEPGSYIIQEVKAKSGFLLDDTPKTIDVKGSGTYNIELFNQPLGSLVIHKYSSLDRKTPLAGVQFKVTYAPGCVVDDENGKVSSNGIYYTESDGTITINGIVGTVTITEQATIPGYTIDPATQSQTIVVNPDDVQHAYFYNTPKNTLIIEKYIEEEGSEHKPLKGVTFMVTDSSGAVVGNSNGEYVSGDDGRVVIPGVEPGSTISVREIKVPDGVVLDGIPKTIKISEDDANILRFYNKKTGYLVIQKKDKNTLEPLSGVEFELTYAEGGYVDDAYGHLSSKGRFTTNEMGEIRVPVVGTVVVKEVKCLPGYVMDPETQVQTVTVNPADTQTLVFYNEGPCSLVLSKKDAVTGKPVPNTEFTLKDGSGNILGRYTTGADGTVTVTGLLAGSTVVAFESKVPSGYVLDSTPQTIVLKSGSNSYTSGTVGNTNLSSGGNGNTLDFENQPTVTLTIEKYLKTEAGEVPLKGVTFLVTDSSGKVIGSSNGEFITGADGRIVISNLEPGITVTAREISVPDGVVLDSAPKSILIEKGMQSQTLRFVNQKTGYLVVRKLDKVSKEPLSGVEFELTYAEGGYVDDVYGHLSSKGRFTTNDMGEIRVPVVGTVVVKEVTPCPGYIIDEATKIQTVTVNPADTQTITVYNEPLCSLTLTKLDAVSGKPVPNTEFTLKDGDGNILGRYTTGSDGTVTVTGLIPNSTVVVVETKVPSNYVLDSTPRTIIVRNGSGNRVTTGTGSSGTVSGGNVSGGTSGGNSMTVENLPKTTLTIEKYLKTKTGEVPLKGVTFLVTDSSGAVVGASNGEFTSDENGRIVIPNLEPGITITAKEISVPDGVVLDSTPKSIEIKGGDGFKLDATPHYFTVEDNKCTTLTVTNKAFSGILIHKIDSVTKKGIYGVSFLLYDSTNTPVGQYTSDNQGFVYIENISTAGRYYLRELENEGYITDTQRKTVYVNPGETTLVEWENTPITGQIQITKKSADYNSTNGLPAGTLLEGAVFEIYDKASNLVDTIKSDSRGLAVSRQLPLGRYTIRETKAPANYGVSDTVLTAYLEHEGEIVRFEVTNKSMTTGVAITKTGPAEVMASQPVNYTFSGIANSSNVRLDNFYWRDTLPAEVRLSKIVTGTYNFPGTYKITYRVNGGEPQTLADNLSTQKNYTLAASPTALGLASNQRVTEVMFVFGQAPGGFAQVEKPQICCIAIAGIKSTSFVNKADVGGTYNGVWVQAVSRWVTTVYGKKVPTTPLPRTGY